MKKYIIIIVFFSLFINYRCVTYSNRNVNKYEIRDTSFVFTCGENNKDFGCKKYSDVAIVQPKSLFVSGCIAYVLDPFNKCVKSINLKDGNLQHSLCFPDSVGLLNDLICFKERIVVTTEKGYLVFLDRELNFSKINLLASSSGVFYDIEKESFIVYFPAEELVSYKIDQEGKILDRKNEFLDFRSDSILFHVSLEENGLVRTKYGEAYLKDHLSNDNFVIERKYFYTDKCFYSFCVKNNKLRFTLQNVNWN